jgi:anthraniloyl-CoA monooxygenase
MRITILGGGPAGFYCGLLLKKATPAHEITVLERNPAGATYGWGVVFSDRTLSAFREADFPTYQAITDRFVTWDAIDTYYRGERIRCGGHAFAGLARKELLSILQQRCAELGVAVTFEREIRDLAELPPHDLLIAADGVNGLTRLAYAEVFRPRVEQGRAKYVWFGTDLVLDAFTFIFRENEHGFFQVHAYPFAGELGTFIVETDEATWRRAALAEASEAESIAYCERLFAAELRGHRLLGNRSLWGSFPTLKCAAWHTGNVVLLGDSAHTAHFSIGSGTKLAMEDAIALANALGQYPDLGRALTEYELTRRPAVEALQQAARESQRYFETLARHKRLPTIPFTFNLLTRSGRLTYDDLRLRDPGFGVGVDQWFASSQDSSHSKRRAFWQVNAPPAFTPLHLAGLTIPNRVALAQKIGCVESSNGPGGSDLWVTDGEPWNSGGGLLLTGPVAISADARISGADCALDTDASQAAWTRLVTDCHNTAGKVGIVLNHAGRRGAVYGALASSLPDHPLREDAWPLLAPSALPYTPTSQVPREMTRAEMDRVRDDFVAATRRAAAAGFDLLLLHMARGYLLGSFLSPLANHRTDDYGGTLEHRLRFPLEVFDAVRAVWPEDKPLGVVLLCDDCAPGGLTEDEAVTVAGILKKHGCDLIQPLAGQTIPSATLAYGRGYLTRYSDRIRNEAGIVTLLDGYLTTLNEINTAIAGGRADLCVLTPRYWLPRSLASEAPEIAPRAIPRASSRAPSDRSTRPRQTPARQQGQ